jgi:hypothetical protein
MTTKTDLWVDDVRMPSGWECKSREEREQDSQEWVVTYDQATRALATGQYRSVSLDFSLDETDPSHCGLDVAEWILQEADAGRLPRLRCYIHSIHPRAHEMQPYLLAAEESWKAWERKRNPEAAVAVPVAPVVQQEKTAPRICRCGTEIKNPGRFCDSCAQSFKRKHKKPRK